MFPLSPFFPFPALPLSPLVYWGIFETLKTIDRIASRPSRFISSPAAVLSSLISLATPCQLRPGIPNQAQDTLGSLSWFSQLGRLTFHASCDFFPSPPSFRTFFPILTNIRNLKVIGTTPGPCPPFGIKNPLAPPLPLSPFSSSHSAATLSAFLSIWVC